LEQLREQPKDGSELRSATVTRLRSASASLEGKCTFQLSYERTEKAAS
jgi:hypothetical protein